VADFAGPPAAGYRDEQGHGRGDLVRRPAPVEGDEVRAGDRAADQQEVAGAGGGDQRPVAVAGPLGAVSAGPAFEHGVVEGVFGLDQIAGREGDPEVAGGDPDVRQAAFLAFLPELAASRIDLVERSPCGGHAGVQEPSELLPGQLRLGLVPQAAGDACGAAPLPAFLPALGHEHVEVDPGLARCGHPRGEHRGDAVLDVARAPGVLRRRARRGVPVLELGGLVERDPRPDHVPPVVGQPRQREGRQLAAQLLPVPPARPEQGLHPVRGLVSGRLGQSPAVRLHSRRQPPDVVQRGPDGAPLRHHPPQHRADLRIRRCRAAADITYPGPSGRVVAVCGHASGNTARPPRISLV